MTPDADPTRDDVPGPERRQRVEEVCDAALDREPRDRVAFVAAAVEATTRCDKRWRRCWRTRRQPRGF